MLVYTYDLAGNRTSITAPNGTTTFTYDQLNRLATVTDPDSGQTIYTYDNVGNRASVTYPNGTYAQYTYDALNRLTKLENKKADGSTVSKYNYTLGPAGNRVAVSEYTGRTVNYTYDELYRLITEEILDPNDGDQTITYTYDSFGNRLTKTDNSGTTNYTYDDNDRLIAENTFAGLTTYTYDNNGNTIRKDSPTESVDYSYDYENRLVNISTLNDNIDCGYDADGIRVSKNVNGQNIDFVVDKNRQYAQVLEEYENGSLTTEYIHGDDLISQTRGANTSYYHYDGQLSTRQLSDASSAVTDEYKYDAFGNLINQTGSTQNNYLYTGEQYDPNAGFYYLRARYYDQSLGRLLGLDPFSGHMHEPASLHRYIYAGNNPVMNIDPSGETTLSDQTAANNMISNLQTIAKLSNRILGVYDKVMTVKDIYMNLRALIDYVGNMSDFKASFSPKFKSVNFKEAAQTFMAMATDGINRGKVDWIEGYIKSRIKRHKLVAYLIYTPNFSVNLSTYSSNTSKTRVGSTKGLPVKLVYGGPTDTTGRVFGIGVEMGKQRQLLRMDLGPLGVGHGGKRGRKGGEIDIIEGDNYHMHVLKWK